MTFKRQPNRILLLKPCCIGDVIMATALLAALRRAYPQAKLTWGIGTHSAPALAGHPSIDNLLNTGPAANPARSLRGLAALAWQIRTGRFDLAAVPERSPLIGLATFLAGVPVRAGLDSAGRGRFYNVRAPIDPAEPRHEADIYLDVARALHLDVADCWANIPANESHRANLPLEIKDRSGPIIVHVGGGVNPGMTMTEKRPPIPLLVEVAARAAETTKGPIVMIGGPGDQERANAFQQALKSPHSERMISLIGVLDFPGAAALGSIAALTIGPDTGLMHLMAAAGAPTVMIFGPSDPRRYAPFVPPGRAVAPWKPLPLPPDGVVQGPPPDWSWEQHGVSIEEVWEQAKTILE